MSLEILVLAAICPVAVLCYFIYKRDVHKESFKILAKLFALGFFSCIPIVVVELLLADFFPVEGISSSLVIFINVFISVALVEEGFKWVITKYVGYNSREFDEIYDIIVYSVFVSLGFACIENILYVTTYGLGNAVMRAVLSIPGHMCFAVSMGYYFAQAKVGSVNNKKDMVIRNLLYSILVPALLHTCYDALIFCGYILPFLCFDIVMVCYCFGIVDKVSKMQNNIINNVNNGSLVKDENGYIKYNQQNVSQTNMQMNASQIHFCPICGKGVNGENFCRYCGFHLK